MTKEREATPVLVGILILVVVIFAAVSVLNRKQPSHTHTTTVTTHIVHVYPPDPSAHHTTAGAIAADQEWWKHQVALDHQAGARYPTWMLGYRVEAVNRTLASIDNYLAQVWVGGTSLRFTAETVNLRWNGQRWVFSALPLIEALGSTPRYYAQFTPLP